MPKPDAASTASDRVNADAQGLHIQTRAASDAYDPREPNLLAIPALAWRVTDLQTGVSMNFAIDGGHFKSQQGHKYAVQLTASASAGIQKLILGGSGSFRCRTQPDRNDIVYDAPSPLTISIPHEEFDSPALPMLPPKSKDLALNAFDYFQLSAGFHRYANMPSTMEFFAVSGTMVFRATAINPHGVTASGSLTTAP
ncbi:MAG TPA: hypothetical protein VH596_18000 [Terriglobales bacterium]